MTLLTAIAAPVSGGLMLEAAKHLLLAEEGGSWGSALLWTIALLCWWFVLALLWLNRARFEVVDVRNGATIRRPLVSIPLLAGLIVMASGLGLVSAIGTVSG
jgi:hypothetical protein